MYSLVESVIYIYPSKASSGIARSEDISDPLPPPSRKREIERIKKKHAHVTHYQFSNASMRTNTSKMVIKKKKKETWIRGYKEEIQTMSLSRQIDTVNRTTTGSAATIISRSFAVETRLRRDTSCVWRHFIGEDFCAASMNTRERGEKKRKERKKRKKTSTEVEKDPQERYTRDAEDT